MNQQCVKIANEIYKEMTEKGFNLEYLNVEYNLEESKKNIEKIIENAKMINLEGAMFDLKTMLEYYDSLFHKNKKTGFPKWKACFVLQ